ncbi:orotidine-5'-phosphate decarboxylase [Salinibacterium sp.]|uniref:orotidine-5'-phosphate decarboxylase n=1 Tax=Salinibacterium sp. TaxID=1915057 RepID=UPI00286CD428|nr:orotidine-5'-phosphate decarboxylase [Salinibacterium sp.]
MPSFGQRLEGVFAARGQLCLGIDPHEFLLESWGLPDTAAGLREFGLRCVDAATGAVGIIKPQVAFFERHGSAGYAALEDVLAAARAAELLIIADAKRGDVGSTVSAYGAAWLTPGSPLEVDAMTVSAYQGVGSLSGALELAKAGDKGMFVLAATSNPESVAPQNAVLDRGGSVGRTVAASIVAEVHLLNSTAAGLGSTGVVIGATVAFHDYGIRVGELESTPILGPGFGEQGAQVSDLSVLYGAVCRNVVVNVSRSVLRAGPDGLRSELTRQAGLLIGVAGS